MKRITPNVYVEDGRSVPPNYRGCNTSFVTTSDGIVMIDSPQMPSDAVAWRAEIERHGSVRYLINTDHHGDHTMGNFFFPGTVVAHERVRDVFLAAPGQKIVKPGQRRFEMIREKVAEIDPEGLALIDTGYVPRRPSITFSKAMSVHVGEHAFELYEMPGHTAGTIGVHLPKERVFFAGDNFTYRTQASMEDSSPLAWVDTLRRIEALDVDYVVGGHGEVAPADAVRPFRMFFEQCLDLVRDAIDKGMSRDEAANRLSFEHLHPGHGEVQAVHPGPAQQRLNVTRLYDALTPRP